MIKTVTACESVKSEIKEHINELAQVKAIEVYGAYNARYSRQILALIDLMKTSYGASILN